ncbi:MAG: hypothetical protein JRM82_02310 [Nitrososphaerota archaeon]|nr:hypothetical protein [Nitrososphaerota archaeon]MDG7018579.1 hypothetical protein [Nitrososphaerota archaeon]MDG7020253.1 hypothetical protein [Nitrososphaerota archaeon]
MGEHSETFTLDVERKKVKDLIVRHLTGFGYRLSKEQGWILVFERGSLRKNIYTTSFDSAYKQVIVSLVGDESVPVTTVSISFSLPFLILRKNDMLAINNLTKALKDYIVISTGYAEVAEGARRPLRPSS